MAERDPLTQIVKEDTLVYWERIQMRLDGSRNLWLKKKARKEAYKRRKTQNQYTKKKAAKKAPVKAPSRPKPRRKSA